MAAIEPAERELQKRLEVFVWWELTHNTRSFGVSEEDLLKNTGTKREELYAVLEPLVESGIVQHRLQQIGTAGIRDHYYRLVEAQRIFVRKAAGTS